MNNLLEYKGGKVEGGRGKKIIPFSNTSYFPTSPLFFFLQKTEPANDSGNFLATFHYHFRQFIPVRLLFKKITPDSFRTRSEWKSKCSLLLLFFSLFFLPLSALNPIIPYHFDLLPRCRNPQNRWLLLIF